MSTPSSGTAPTGDKASPQKGGSKKVVVIALVAVLLLSGGAGSYWFFVMRPQAAAHETEGHDPDGEQSPAKSRKKAKRGGAGAALRFDPFVVNLADEGGTRYLRLGLSLVIDGNEAEAKEIEEGRVKLLRVRSAVLDLLSQQLADHVVTPQGKQELREAIEAIANEALAPAEVTDVLFTEFVVQF